MQLPPARNPRLAKPAAKLEALRERLRGVWDGLHAPTQSLSKAVLGMLLGTLASSSTAVVGRGSVENAPGDSPLELSDGLVTEWGPFRVGPRANAAGEPMEAEWLQSVLRMALTVVAGTWNAVVPRWWVHDVRQGVRERVDLLGEMHGQVERHLRERAKPRWTEKGLSKRLVLWPEAGGKSGPTLQHVLDHVASVATAAGVGGPTDTAHRWCPVDGILGQGAGPMVCRRACRLGGPCNGGTAAGGVDCGAAGARPDAGGGIGGVQTMGIPSATSGTGFCSPGGGEQRASRGLVRMTSGRGCHWNREHCCYRVRPGCSGVTDAEPPEQQVPAPPRRRARSPDDGAAERRMRPSDPLRRSMDHAWSLLLSER